MSKPRKILIMRHAERVDTPFENWISECFDKCGNYKRTDANLPEKLPKRKNSPQSFHCDAPLTNIGTYQAILTGQFLKAKGLKIKHAYCSPSLRSIQTCDGVLKGLGVKDKVQIRVEPALCEHTAFSTCKVKQLMTQKELVENGYNVDTNYIPLKKVDEVFNKNETVEDYYRRNVSVTKFVEQAHQKGNILIVGHACNLDVNCRQLLGDELYNIDDLTEFSNTVPYCAMVSIQKSSDGIWKITESPVKITYSMW